MPTTDELAARLAVVEQRIGITPPDGTKQPPPAPTGLSYTTRPTGQIVLTWDDAPDVTWEVRDEANPANPVKEAVTESTSLRSKVTPGGPDREYVIVAIGPTGLRSEPSEPLRISAGGGGGQPTPPPRPGSGGVDLLQWKLTIPEVKDGKVVEIRPPALARYSDRYFAQVDGGVRFRCWHGGGTTANSSNPRSELRERVGDDPEGYWNAGKGWHSMEWTGQVNRLTRVKPHVVLGQVHDKADDVVVLRLEAEKLWLTDGDNPHGFLVDPAFQLGKPYSCKFEVVNGDYSFSYNGQRLDYPLRSTAPSYWKIGNYLQSNSKSAPGESTDEYAEVVVHSVTVSHS